MDRARKPWLRGAIALGVMGAMAASLLISPASAHLGKFGHLKKHIKKIATQRINALVPGMIGALAIEETELVRWGPIKLNVGTADQTIGTFGPFTLKAQCLDSDATADTDINIRVGVTTTENNSSLNQYYGTTDDDFDTGEDGDWYDFIDGNEAQNNPGDPQNMQTFGDGFAYAAAPSGASLWGETNAISNFSGSHCWLKGHVLVNG